MATITSLVEGDGVTAANSMAKINDNFTNLNADKIETSVKDTDTTLAANSDDKIPSQKAVKAYVDVGGNVNASTTAKGIVEEATAAEVAAGTAAGGTGARLFMNPSTAGTKFSTTQVFSGNSADNSWIDLDLSSVVGATSRVVLLKVVNNGASTIAFMFRRNGDTTDYYINRDNQACNITIIANTGGASYMLVTTDSAGVVERNATGAFAVVITMEAYW